MFCGQCGNQLSDNAKFCGKCGKPVEKKIMPQSAAMSTASVEPTTAAAPAAPTAPTNAATTAAPAAPTAPTNAATTATPAAPTPAAEPSASAVPETPAPQKKKPGGKRWLIALPVVAVLIAACVFLGLYIGQNSGEEEEREHKKAKKETEEVVTTEAVTPAPVPVATEKPVETTPTPVENQIANRTIMVYMIGSNLETESCIASQDINEMMKANSSDNLKIVLQTGGTLQWANPAIKNGKVQRFEIKNNQLIELENLGAISMVETTTLTDFIRFAKSNYPAKEYELVLWDHGGSVPIGFGTDELFDGELTDVEIGRAIKNADIHFDALIFNACEMCSLELFMALKDNVDYVVAAESVVYGYGIYGSGINYTSWINLAVDEKVSTQNFCEQILDDYVEFLADISSKGSMSVIRMDRVQEVYDAYVNYIREAYYDLLDGGYASFIQARENSGVYEGTDAVDISTLAAKYENDYSTQLQNAVTNAVVRTKSDISYGHGITAYSPYLYAHAYDYGRESFEVLGYDDIIFDFYDLLASKILYYDDMVAYAGDWYVDQQDEENYGHGNSYDLDFDVWNGHQIIALSDEDWGIVKDVQMYVAQDLDDLNLRYLYGSDVQFELDDNGYIKVAPPQYWMFINDYIPTSHCEFRTEDEDGWYQVYFVYGYVNGQEAFLRVDCSGDNVDGYISGYYLTDEDFYNYDDGHLFENDDAVQLAAVVYEDGERQIRTVGRLLSGGELFSEFKSLDYDADEEVLVFYEITDVYGNVYSTEVTTASRY